MTESEYSLIPYNENILPPEKSDITLEGEKGWQRLVSRSNFASAEHLIIERNGEVLFDKLRLVTSPAVFVVPVRINQNNKAEFLLINEWKYLLEKRIPQIPQGRVNKGETGVEAALRETREEIGYDPIGMVYIGEQNFDSAHMSEFQPFYLAIIPYEQEQSTKDRIVGEDIRQMRWMSLEEIRRLGISDGKTTIGLALAENVLREDLI